MNREQGGMNPTDDTSEKWVCYAGVWLSRAEDTRFWSLFDSGAEIGEIAAEFKLPVAKIREMLALPPLADDEVSDDK